MKCPPITLLTNQISPLCSEKPSNSNRGIIIVGSDDTKGLLAAEQHAKTFGPGIGILIVEPEKVEVLKSMLAVGVEPQIEINENGLTIIGGTPFPKHEMFDAVEKLNEMMKELKKASHCFPTTTTAIHPKFAPKYQPIERLPNTNKPRKKTKRKK